MELCLKSFALIALILAGCATTQPPTRIDQLINTPPFDHAVWGVYVEDDAGRVLYDVNGHRLEMPASNRKLFSAATDANCLGLTTQLSTELWREGYDVIVKGDGDPSFASTRHESPGFAPFVAALQTRGIAHVRHIIMDVSRFDRVTIPQSWEIGDLTSSDAPPVDAIAYNENVEGDDSVEDAAINAGQHLADDLHFAHINVDGAILLNVEPRAWSEKIATIQSPMVAQLLMSVLKNSQNNYAETLYKRSSPHGSYEESEALERDFAINEAHIDGGEFFFRDGSGLTRRDLVTPAALVKLLRWMNAPERRGVWWLIMGEPGGEGTLRRRLTDIGPRLRAKTGTLTGVHALSGVVAGKNGGYRYFSIMINHHLAGEATRVIDEIVREIAKF